MHFIVRVWEGLAKSGTPGGTRTPDLLLRRQLLYPAELLAHLNGAGDGNRTRVSSLEGWCSTIELHPQVLSRMGIQLRDFNTSFSTCQVPWKDKLLFSAVTKEHVIARPQRGRGNPVDSLGTFRTAMFEILGDCHVGLTPSSQ